jgi:hypothetical protein
MDEIPTIIELLKTKSIEYRQAFHKRALELELAARDSGQDALAELYAEIVDQYLDMFDAAWLLVEMDFEELIA